MNPQHDRANDETTTQSVMDEIREFRQTFDAGVSSINHRLDHLTGKHDVIRQLACPSCEVRDGS